MAHFEETMNIEILPWILSGLLIPLFVALVFLFLIALQIKWEIFSPSIIPINSPPDKLSPALVGLLFEKKISPRQIAATLIDLANRGYLILGYDQESLFFTPGKKPDNNLRNYEKVLLSELFERKRLLTSFQTLRLKSAKSLFSPQIFKVYDLLNQESAKVGLFKGNPHLVRIPYKLTGLVVYFLSALSIIFVFLFGYNNLYLWPLAGILFSAILMIKSSYLFPVRDIQGHVSYLKWWRFRLYLKENLLSRTSGSSLNLNQQFYQYLPYALSFGLEKKWFKKFKGYTLGPPSWMYQPGEKFDISKKILPLVKRISISFSLLRGPQIN